MLTNKSTSSLHLAGNHDSLLEELKICKMWLEKLFIWCRGSGILPCPEEFDFPLKNLSEKVTGELNFEFFVLPQYVIAIVTLQMFFHQGNKYAVAQSADD